MSEPFRWVVVVAPRGDVVRLHERYSEYQDAASLFVQRALDGRLGGPHDTFVTVNGAYISLAWRGAA